MFRLANNNNYPANWVADLYTTPDPDFGPPLFNHAMDGTACPPAVASSCRQGFRYTYTSAAGAGTYSINANPDGLGSTGTRSFFVDESGVVRHCTGTGATVTDPAVDAPVIAC